MFIMPSNGKHINGRKAVTGMGTASVTHDTIIQAASANTLFAPGEIKLPGIVANNKINRIGPAKNPS